MKRVLLVTYHFPPSSAVGARRPARLARLLPDHGFEVDVVCGEEEGGWAKPDLTQRALIDDATKIRRIETPFVFGRNPAPGPPDEPMPRFWWKTRAYAESVLLTKDWSWRWGRAAVRRLDAELTAHDYDILVANAPPRPAIAPFVRWADEHGIPVVVDLRDVWASAVESWPWWWPLHPKIRRRRWSLRLRGEVLGHADHIVTNTPEMADLMRKRMPELPPGRFSAVPNAYELLDDPHPPRAGEAFRLVHTGSLAYGRSEQAAALVRALAVLDDRGKARVEFVQAGAGGDNLLHIAKDHGVADRVQVHEWLDRSDAVKLQREASALVLFQSRLLAADVAVPAKLFEYMSRRKPVLALVGEGPADRIVKEANLGMTSNSWPPETVADVVEALLHRVRDQPVLPAPPKKFSEEATVAQLATVLDGVLTESTGPMPT